MSNINALRGIIAAALYDFAGRLTATKPSFKVGSDSEVYPVLEALKVFLKDRGCETVEDPPIREWQDRVALLETCEQVNEEATPLSFRQDLMRCINRWSKDTDYGMPDFVLAEMVVSLLDTVGKANAATENFLHTSIADRVATEHDPDPSQSLQTAGPDRVHHVNLHDTRCESQMAAHHVSEALNRILSRRHPWPFPKGDQT